MNVLVINHCSTNKGDRAVLEFVIRELIRYGASTITVTASEPRQWEGGGIDAEGRLRFIPWVWRIEPNSGHELICRAKRHMWNEWYKYAYRRVRSQIIHGGKWDRLQHLFDPIFGEALMRSDVVISTGGHHVTTLLAVDAISPQILEMSLALLAEKPLVLWSQSIGPLNFCREENRMLIKKILCSAYGIYVRDDESIRELGKFGVMSERVHQTYESVFGLGDSLPPIAKPSIRPKSVGVSVYCAQRRSHQEYSRYISLLGRLVDHAITLGYSVQFFPMELEGEVGDDRGCIRDILAMVKDRTKCSIFECGGAVIDQIAQVARCRVFIAHKTHSVIFSLISGTPLVAISYHPKTNDFMAQFGIGEQCIDEAEINEIDLRGLFERALIRMDEISDLELAKNKLFCDAVKEDFREMLVTVMRSV